MEGTEYYCETVYEPWNSFNNKIWHKPCYPDWVKFCILLSCIHHHFAYLVILMTRRSCIFFSVCIIKIQFRNNFRFDHFLTCNIFQIKQVWIVDVNLFFVLLWNRILRIDYINKKIQYRKWIWNDSFGTCLTHCFENQICLLSYEYR